MEELKDKKSDSSDDSLKEKNILPSTMSDKDQEVSLLDIKKLLEKNLKWSQIIYEQNRKINRKLMWQAVSGWVRVFVILIPLILAVWFLPSYINQFLDKYGSWFGIKKTPVTTTSDASIEQILKMVPLDAAKQEQLKAILK